MQSHAPDTTYTLLQDIEQLLIKIISKLNLPRINPNEECESTTFYGLANDFMINKIFLDFTEVKGVLHLLTVLQTKYKSLPENYLKLKARNDNNPELKKYDEMLTQFFKESAQYYDDLNNKINDLKRNLSLIEDSSSIEDRYNACVLRYKQQKQEAEEKEVARILQITPNRGLITAWDSILQLSKEIMDIDVAVPMSSLTTISFKPFSYSLLNLLGIEIALTHINELLDKIEAWDEENYLSISHNADVNKGVESYKEKAPELKDKMSRLKKSCIEYKQQMMAHLQLKEETSSNEKLEILHQKVQDACNQYDNPNSPTHFKRPEPVLTPSTLASSSKLSPRQLSH